MINLNAELFEALVGKRLSATMQAGSETWLVDSVSRRKGHSARADQPFDVYFSAPAGKAALQGMVQATLPDGEAIEFFVVPVGATADAVTYEAVFN